MRQAELDAARLLLSRMGIVIPGPTLVAPRFCRVTVSYLGGLPRQRVFMAANPRQLPKRRGLDQGRV